MLLYKNKHFFIKNKSLIGKLYKSKIGIHRNNILTLNNIEAAYLWEIKDLEADKNPITLITPKDLLKYFVYRDLRIRGLKPHMRFDYKGNQKPLLIYKRFNINYPKFKINIIKKGDFYISFDKEAENLYKTFWLGQYGLYKKNMGKIAIFDELEAAYLYGKGISHFKVVPKNKLLYNVYKEWRDLGFIPKTAFKLGGGLRIYLPNTTPENPIHSKHILHVVSRIKTENWTTIIRVVHGIKKTYLLALPKVNVVNNFIPDFAVIDRSNSFSYYVKCLSSSNIITSNLLAKALDFSLKTNAPMVFAIVDQESSISYYIMRKVIFDVDTVFNYFEVDWLQP